eukprot:CAMPEP_0170254276 /NCGR_PEP_ID=MMETSP0116_2-20130129/26985_1 /TAXON_ID=400756 /ORGANISM="Durinskia baltica, Strain CSIRO CS-38" /LENGTH=583 /DNA_ID=CAMNT_0010505273 /DNA_START=60 /DNA_END=1810 /DNA_ORIENTATION=+
MTLSRCRVALGAIAACAAVVAAVQVPTLDERIENGECSRQPPSQVGSYFPTNVQASSSYESAQLFDIVYSEAFKIVISRVAKEQYVLTQCGQSKPTDAEVDAAVPLETGYQRKHFDIPLLSAAAGSTVHLAFLDYLDVDDRIRYVDSNAVGPCWQKALTCGSALASEYGGNATLREIQTKSVDVFFMGCDWMGNCDGVRNQANGVHVPSAQDPSPIKTAEYVKFFAAFFNKEPLAIQHFSSVNATYHAVGKSTGEPKPVVAWIQWLDWKSAYEVSLASYKTLMVTDAGGVNFDAETELAGLDGLERIESTSGVTYAVNVDAYNTSSDQDGSFEAVRGRAAAALMSRLAGVDAVVDETYEYDPRSYDLDKFKDNFYLTGSEDYAFMTSQRVARFDGTLGNSPTFGWDWYESRLARPDLAVEGLARVLWPSNSFERRFFRNIAAGETVLIVFPADCKETLPVCDADAEPLPIKTLDKDATQVDAAFSGEITILALVPFVSAAMVAARVAALSSSGADVSVMDVARPLAGFITGVLGADIAPRPGEPQSNLFWRFGERLSLFALALACFGGLDGPTKALMNARSCA